jgi:hypothetical protein
MVDRRKATVVYFSPAAKPAKENEMPQATWKSDPVQIRNTVCVEIRANAQGGVLGQSDDVWFHDLHLTAEQMRAIAVRLIEGADKVDEAARGEK